MFFKRKPEVVRFTTLSRVNEPLARVVEPMPPWWRNDRAKQLGWWALRRLESVATNEAVSWIKDALFRRPVREA